MTRLPLDPSVILGAVFGDASGLERTVDAWADALEARLDRERHRRAVDRIRRAFMHEMQPVPRLLLGGLAHWRLRGAPQPPVPWGWCRRRAPDRDLSYVVPLWLAAGLALWDRRWTPVEWGRRLGVVRLAGGDYYRAARPCWPAWLRRATWCFLNDIG